MGNRYCKKDYSNGEVNVVEVTQIRLYKMEKDVAMTSFYCLASRIWKKVVFYVGVKGEKNNLVCVIS